MQLRLRSPESRPSTSTHASANAPRAAYGQSYSAAVPRTVRSPRNLKGSATEYHDVGVKTINKFNPIPYSTLKNSYFVVYRRGLGNI